MLTTLIASLLDLAERLLPADPARPNMRFAEHNGYTIRHTRSTGCVEVFNRRRRLVSTWTGPSFHRAVVEAKARLVGPGPLSNPWMSDWRRSAEGQRQMRDLY